MADPRRPSGRVEGRLRRLPSVEELASASDGEPRNLLLAAAREELAALRTRILAGEDVAPNERRLRDAVTERAARLREGSLRRVINATGVILHTNLGRAPLAPEATAAALRIASGYSNLEYLLEDGSRGSRHAHLEPLLRDLTGAQAAIAVNNNAAAVLLALAATSAGREVIVSRGQLVEIGGSFRIPEILAQSGGDAGRGRNHQPHPTVRLRGRDRRADRRDHARPPVQLSHRRLRRSGPAPGAGRPGG